MTGQDLKRLASTASVARLDLGEASLELRSTGDELAALYLGGFVLARATVPAAIPPFTVTVLADQFQKLVSIIPDNDTVTLTCDETHIEIKTSGRKQIKLGCSRTMPELLNPDLEDVLFSATAPVEVLREEVIMAANFTADEHSPQQLLTGVRIGSNGAKLSFMAYDGTTALMTSSVTPKEIVGKGSVTVPAAELINGLKLLSGDVRVQATERRLYLTDHQARFDSVTFDHKWPDYLARLRAIKDYAFSITVQSADLRDVLKAAKDLASSKLFEIEAKDSIVSIRTVGSPFGQFVAEIEDGTQATGLWRYSLTAMAGVSKLGDVVTLQIPTNPDHPTYVKVGTRECWFNAHRWGR